jgi:predicted SnoaL-like aldol condensation-catalyzing enzyme
VAAGKDPPGAGWRSILSRNGTKEFAAAFSADAALGASVLNGPCIGADAIGSFFAVTAGGMYDSLAFTNETVDGGKTFLEWEGKAFGKDIAGTTIITRNEVGLIQSINLYHRPLPALLRFAEELAKRSRGKVDPGLPKSAWENQTTGTPPEQNKAFVLEAFDTLFNKRDYCAAEKFWSDRYIQHSAHIPPGRDGLFGLVRALPHTLRYENHLILAERDYVIAHGRFSGHGRPSSWVAADIVRFEDGKLAEHWDVLQDEATKAESKSGLPMFGDSFPS